MIEPHDSIPETKLVHQSNLLNVEVYDAMTGEVLKTFLMDRKDYVADLMHNVARHKDLFTERPRVVLRGLWPRISGQATIPAKAWE